MELEPRLTLCIENLEKLEAADLTFGPRVPATLWVDDQPSLTSALSRRRKPEHFPARSGPRGFWGWGTEAAGGRGPDGGPGPQDSVLKVARRPAESPPLPNKLARAGRRAPAPPRGARTAAGPAAESGARAPGALPACLRSPRAGRVWPGTGYPGRGEGPPRASAGFQTPDAGESHRSLPVPRTTLSLGVRNLVGPEDFF